MANVPVQHSPAVKVGGRRLSTTTRHTKPRLALDMSKSTDCVATNSTEGTEDDYPRPAAPGEGEEHTNNTPHEEEAPPKKEKKHNQHENERKMKESAHWKVEYTRPTRDTQPGSRSFGAAGRIAQPAGKALFV
ncbi:hypothetical protein AX16_001333 [Volvariella volvacea WC 439]|nr:hypothetical protein AX16_001333 [Volvariella volvacea WC 439]